MGSSMPKSVKKKLRELATEAYERELGSHLEVLYKHFVQWKEKKMSGDELCDKIHEYDQGPLKELFSKYIALDDEILVGFAVAKGIFTEDEIPEEILPYIKNSRDLASKL